MEIVPAILTGDPLVLTQQLTLVQELPEIKAVQLDIVDALFTDNVTITPSDIQVTMIDDQDLVLDFHLMTEEPMDYVWELLDQAYLPVRTVYGQIERMSNQLAFVQEVKKHNWRAGLALDLTTPISSLDEEVWPEVDAVLLMAVEAGEQGQAFQVAVLEKIKHCQHQLLAANNPAILAVDGGIKVSHLAQLQAAGVTQVAVGSALFASADFHQAYQQLQKGLHESNN